MKKTAIYGGTFNPLHLAHFEVIKTVADSNLVDDILLIPTKVPPHKECDFLAEEKHRLNMCKIAASKFSNVFVSDIELNRVGKSYTYDTVMQLKEICPAEYYFICGTDMVCTFLNWYKAQELLKEVNLIAIRRGGTDDTLFDLSVDDLRSKGANITVLDMEPMDISSTKIRSSNEKDKYLIEEIAEYIKENNLYGG